MLGTCSMPALTWNQICSCRVSSLGKQFVLSTKADTWSMSSPRWIPLISTWPLLSSKGDDSRLASTFSKLVFPLPLKAEIAETFLCSHLIVIYNCHIYHVYLSDLGSIPGLIPGIGMGMGINFWGIGIELELLKSRWNLKRNWTFYFFQTISTQMQERHIVVEGGISYCQGCTGVAQRGVGC